MKRELKHPVSLSLYLVGDVEPATHLCHENRLLQFLQDSVLNVRAEM